MLQKFLIVLLVLAAGFAISGVSAVVLAQVKTNDVNELTTVSLEEDRREVRLVVIDPKEDTNDDAEEDIKQVIKKTEEEVDKKESKRQTTSQVSEDEVKAVVEQLKEDVATVSEEVTSLKTKAKTNISRNKVHKVPFYSQFTDITPANWRKVGCGIASTAMLIDYYSDETVSVDELLQRGIAAGAFLSDAGWTHQGLINLTKKFGLNGESRSLASLSMTDAFNKLEEVVSEGPVMVSVHYTFEPTNPIPHLVVVSGVSNGKVFYNDPAEPSGEGSLSIEKFKSAWKKRYISIRPNT